MEPQCASIRGPTMRPPARDVLAFATILATCVAGILHLSWWAALAGACVLALISISNYPVAYRALSSSASTPGTLLFSSAFNASIISTAALVAGRAIGWVWGV
jgi:hypothetical protein